MNPIIEVDPTYIAARRVLLDALDALDAHLDSVVLVGAQAIYLHTRDADLDAGVAAHTTDADLAIDPVHLAAEPAIAEAMRTAGFHLMVKAGGALEPGIWIIETMIDGEPKTVPVDLIVPAALSAGRRRDARLPNHGDRVARIADGLEAAVIDHIRMTVASLEPAIDHRSRQLNVATIPALLIAKAFKVAERLEAPPEQRARSPHRIHAKDAGDILRLMRGPMTAAAVGRRLGELAQHAAAGDSVRRGVNHLATHFGHPRSEAVSLAAAALTGALDGAQVSQLSTSFITAMTRAYNVTSCRT